MTSGQAPEPSEAELHALVDGQLSPARAAELAREVAGDPGLAARVGAYREQNRLLRAALEPELDEPVPARLLRFRSPRARLRTLPGAGHWAIAASLLLGLALGATGGWVGRGERIEQGGLPLSFPGQAALIHATYSREQRHPVEVWAAEEEHLVAWLSKRLGEPLKAPRLRELGFDLVGGRLVAGHRLPAAMFMYQNAEGQRVTLTVRRDAGDEPETGFRYAVEGGVGVFYWVERDFGYAITGELDQARLLAMARVVYGQLATLSPSR